MKALRSNVHSETFPFAIVSYWGATACGIRVATLATASFAHLYVPGLDGAYEGARFDLPDQSDLLRKVLLALEYVFARGRIHKETEIAAALGGVRVLRDQLSFPAEEQAL